MKLFYSGLFLLAAFEILKVYFIMPLPGSQQLDSIDLAYFLHIYRWYFRIVFGLAILAGVPSALKSRKAWIHVLAVVPVILITYFFNFRMTADQMFLQPQTLVFEGQAANTLTDSSLVVAVSLGAEAKAYPIRYIQYHHQVRDTIGNRPVMVTYCNVCRSGRVFEPVVDGRIENFRLVGMNHFNAMFEDQTTGSWWRQATGEAITGKHKGKTLRELDSHQYTLRKFFELHPFGKAMQAETLSKENYDTLGRFEKGKSRGKLTRRDSLSWQDKSWVVGVQIGKHSKAYDWEDLRAKKLIHDVIGSTPIVIALASDDQSFIVMERGEDEEFRIRNDSLASLRGVYNFAGKSKDGSQARVVRSYQEFWHSWKQFHPDTEVFN